MKHNTSSPKQQNRSSADDSHLATWSKHVTVSLSGSGNLCPLWKVSSGDQRWSICTASGVSLHVLDTAGHTMRQSFLRPPSGLHPRLLNGSTLLLITPATRGCHTHTHACMHIITEPHMHSFPRINTQVIWAHTNTTHTHIRCARALT